MSPEQLMEFAQEGHFEARPSANVATALTDAWNRSKPKDLICVTGSIFVVGDLLNQWEVLNQELMVASQPIPVMNEQPVTGP